MRYVAWILTAALRCLMNFRLTHKQQSQLKKNLGCLCRPNERKIRQHVQLSFSSNQWTAHKSALQKSGKSPFVTKIAIFHTRVKPAHAHARTHARTHTHHTHTHTHTHTQIVSLSVSHLRFLARKQRCMVRAAWRILRNRLRWTKPLTKRWITTVYLWSARALASSNTASKDSRMKICQKKGGCESAERWDSKLKCSAPTLIPSPW